MGFLPDPGYNPAMSDRHVENQPRGFPWGTTFFIALPVLYVLSSGPTWCVVAATSKYGHAWECFYKPLRTGLEHVGGAGLFGNYINWWADLFHIVI